MSSSAEETLALIIFLISLIAIMGSSQAKSSKLFGDTFFLLSFSETENRLTKSITFSCSVHIYHNWSRRFVNRQHFLRLNTKCCRHFPFTNIELTFLVGLKRTRKVISLLCGSFHNSLQSVLI